MLNCKLLIFFPVDLLPRYIFYCSLIKFTRALVILVSEPAAMGISPCDFTECGHATQDSYVMNYLL